MGVPHIFGETDADAVFGLAYAHAEDDFKTIQDLLMGARGMLGAKYGMKFTPVDYYVELIGVWEDINSRYNKEIPEEIKLICEAYAQGINKYAFENQNDIEKELFPLTGEDIIAGWMYQIPYLYGIEKVLGKLFERNKPNFSSNYNSQKKDLDPLNIDLIGSNVIAVAPKKSDDGYTRLLLNTHQPWSGPTAWYEAQIHSEDGLNMTGGLFPGSPFVNHGHNENIGWSFTSNNPDLIDVYELQINPLNENQYLYDGEWKDLIVRRIKLKVKIFGPLKWTFKRDIYKSIHGPVLKQPHGTYAIRYSGINEMRTLEQFYKMNKSKNMEEFKNAMKMQALPMYNTGYADKKGNIFYVYNALIPKRIKGYNWNGVLPGNTSKTLWTEYIKFQDLPQTTNPSSGYFQNCNANPYLATGFPQEITSNGITNDAGIETHQTNRSLRAIKLYGGDSKVSRTDFYNYKFDNQYEKNSVMAYAIDSFVEDFESDDLELLAAIDLLKNWNLRTDFDNRVAALAILTFPLEFDISKYKHDVDKITKNLKESILKLKSSFGRFDVPLGEVQRLIRGDVSYPLDGGPGNMRAIYSKWEDGKMVAKVGDCYVQIVEWSPEGKVSAQSIHQFGSSTNDQNSKFFKNQSKLFSEKKMKQVWSTIEDIKNNLYSSYNVTSHK
jgi:acyl-homoserine-lactone acylase